MYDISTTVYNVSKTVICTQSNPFSQLAAARIGVSPSVVL